MKVGPNRVGQFPFRKADPEGRKRNFSEVQQPYTKEEVMQEAERCLLCGTPVCIATALLELAKIVRGAETLQTGH